MGRFRSSESEDEALFSEINITPFTDVVLVLLIIFLVTAPLLFETKISLKLPVSSQPALDQEPHPTVVVDASGQIFLGDRPVENIPALVGALRRELLTHRDHTVIVRADRAALHGRVVECLDAARAAGADRLAIAAAQGATPR